MLGILLSAALAVHLGPMGPDAPARQPQMAANASEVVLTFGAGNTIWFSSSHDGGQTFAAPVKVAELGVLPLGRHRGPRIALAGKAIVITAVIGNKPEQGGHAHGLASDGDLVAWRSEDGGRTWSAGKAINDVSAAAREGLHALASDGKGMLFAAWLDDRGGEGKKLYGSHSADGGRTWSANVEIYRSPDGSICQCCHPSVAVGAAGEVVVMWRNLVAGSRDLYLAISRDGVTFSAARKLGNGTWPLNACPMDGGGLAVSAGRILTAWRRDTGVFLAEPGQAERQVGAGKDVALAWDGKRTYVAWVNGPKVEAWIDGRLEVLSNEGAFPSLAALPDGGVVAGWEEKGGIQIRRLR
jgi:hypothetical protein